MPAYQYEPLSSPDSIRLLLLPPSDARDAELKGSLLNTTLKECDYDLVDRYTALSYVWGSSEKPCQILLDDMAFAITRSLNDALRDMRDATRVRRIWADAICINQEDISERNSQVHIMKDVYSTADSTVVYLGGLTKELDAIFEAGPPDKQYALDDTFRYDVARQDVELARVDILARPWFTRVWVLQELVFSKDPWVQCSTKRMRWADVDYLFYYLEPEHSRIDSVMHKMGSFRATRQNRAQPLQDILRSRRGCGAQDPRDLVYANIGVSGEKDIASHLKVDYNDSLLQVFTKAALYINSFMFNPVDLIRDVDDVPTEKRVPGLPSWAPDWRLRPSQCRLNVHPGHWAADRKTRNRNFHGVFHGTLHAFTDGNLPPVIGHIGAKIGVIACISGIIPKKGSQQNPCPVAKDFQQLYKKLAGMSHDTKAFEEQQRHCEVEHEKCCNILSDSWSRWFEGFHETPQAEGSGRKDFVSYFCQWLSKQPTKFPMFWMEDGDSTCERSSILEGLEFYCDYKEGNSGFTVSNHYHGEEFEGRRLAFTQDGECGLVPSQARKGDMVGFLAQGDLPAIFRPKQTDQNSEIGEAIVQALRQGELGALHFQETFAQRMKKLWSTSPADRPSDEILWEFPTEGAVDVEHFSIIGECFFEDWYAAKESRSPKIDNLKVFALH